LQLAHEAADQNELFCFLLNVVDTIISGQDKHSVQPSLERQNDAMIFAASAGDLNKAKKVGSIPVERKNSHKFDVELNNKLQLVLKLDSQHVDTNYNPSKSEKALLDELDKLSKSPKECDLIGLEQYWKATRKKRYAYTIHENVNLFYLAGINIRKASNQGV
jgi:hypothetical protein